MLSTHDYPSATITHYTTIVNYQMANTEHNIIYIIVDIR